jgi:beta-glucosidase
MMYGGYTAPAGIEMAMGGLLKNIDINIGGESDEYYPNSTVKKESPQLTKILNDMLGNVTPTLLSALKSKAADAEVSFEKGCDIAGDDRSGIEAAITLAKNSDVVLLAIGGKYGWGEPCTAGEGRDTTEIGLPGIQEELLQKLCETGVPVVVIHGDVRPLSSKYAKAHANAILETWFPALTGGQAAMDIIFGDYNPAGRLPVTCLEHAGQIPLYSSQKHGNLLSMNQNPGEEFNSFSNGIQKPLWYFGEGLSYTQFDYSSFSADSEVNADGEINISLNVKNTGSMDGEEVVQLYYSDKIASMVRPERELAGFARIALKAGEEKKVTFVMKASQTAFLNEDMEWVVEEGDILLCAGSSSVDIKASADCHIKNTLIVDGAVRGFVANCTTA